MCSAVSIVYLVGTPIFWGSEDFENFERSRKLKILENKGGGGGVNQKWGLGGANFLGGGVGLFQPKKNSFWLKIKK